MQSVSRFIRASAVMLSKIRCPSSPPLAHFVRIDSISASSARIAKQIISVCVITPPFPLSSSTPATCGRSHAQSEREPSASLSVSSCPCTFPFFNALGVDYKGGRPAPVCQRHSSPYFSLKSIYSFKSFKLPPRLTLPKCPSCPSGNAMRHSLWFSICNGLL